MDQLCAPPAANRRGHGLRGRAGDGAHVRADQGGKAYGVSTYADLNAQWSALRQAAPT